MSPPLPSSSPAASKLRVSLPAETAGAAEVDLRNADGNYNGTVFIQARLTVILPGLDWAVAQRVVDAAHQTCPYIEATRGNVDVPVTLA